MTERDRPRQSQVSQISHISQIRRRTVSEASEASETRSVGRDPPGRKTPFSADDGGAFIVFEAVLVAILVFTAILFFTGIGRPTAATEPGGIDLAQNAADILSILKTRSFDGHPFVDDPARTPPEGWVTRLVQGDAQVQDEVDALVSEIVPTGALWVLRLSNGREPIPDPDGPVWDGGAIVLAPDGARTPHGARVAETFVFPLSTTPGEFMNPYDCLQEAGETAPVPANCLDPPVGGASNAVYGIQLAVWFGA